MDNDPRVTEIGRVRKLVLMSCRSLELLEGMKAVSGDSPSDECENTPERKRRLSLNARYHRTMANWWSRVELPTLT